jgi:hypothetical protein
MKPWTDHSHGIQPTCAVTVWDPRPRNNQHHACGEPIVRDGLCAKHLADKERLS